MTASAAQVLANQINAQKSTGPVTEIGKRKVAGNAMKFGLFSKSLILANEDPIEYQSLLSQLQLELNPVGILEHSLLERIAVALWRQKRLIRAETACLESEMMPNKIAAGVSDELGLSYSLSEDDLTEFDADHYRWCQTILGEYKTIETENLPDIGWLKNSAPMIYQCLLSNAEKEQQSPQDFLQGFDQPGGFFTGLARYCRHQIKQGNQRPLILEVAELVRGKRAILKDKLREALSRYQVMLDNELYKAIKALREAQEWRYKALTVIPDDGFVFKN